MLGDETIIMTDPRQVAYHEAGHAVAGYLLFVVDPKDDLEVRIPFSRVRLKVRPDGDCEGVVDAFPTHLRIDILESSVRLIDKAQQFCCAGAAGERLGFGDITEKSIEGDLKKVICLEKCKQKCRSDDVKEPAVDSAVPAGGFSTWEKQ
jgi:hypothetical protein